ncbi:CD3324 family protein [Clostridium sp. C2-6-12]|uniref:CD3324 family protein n=1 Tax=Clostridium sp. C2-6-12 TaxID=2698832 RepID=UPI00136A9EDF|nr:CD3324 family protein [Clostridium sp. C2-6-12]
MKYIKAKNVLPEEIIRVIQEYVDGEFVYIPRKNNNQKAWGEKSGTKDMLKNRDIEIFQKYNNDVPIKNLAQMYYLSEQSIRRIIREQKRSCS